MKNYQYDIFGNLVPVDEIVKREQLAKKDKLKKDNRYIFQKCFLKKVDGLNGFNQKKF